MGTCRKGICSVTQSQSGLLWGGGGPRHRAPQHPGKAVRGPGDSGSSVSTRRAPASSDLAAPFPHPEARTPAQLGGSGGLRGGKTNERVLTEHPHPSGLPLGQGRAGTAEGKATLDSLRGTEAPRPGRATLQRSRHPPQGARPAEKQRWTRRPEDPRQGVGAGHAGAGSSREVLASGRPHTRRSPPAREFGEGAYHAQGFISPSGLSAQSPHLSSQGL